MGLCPLGTAVARGVLRNGDASTLVAMAGVPADGPVHRRVVLLGVCRGDRRFFHLLLFLALTSGQGARAGPRAGHALMPGELERLQPLSSRSAAGLTVECGVSCAS